MMELKPKPTKISNASYDVSLIARLLFTKVQDGVIVHIETFSLISGYCRLISACTRALAESAPSFLDANFVLARLFDSRLLSDAVVVALPNHDCV